MTGMKYIGVITIGVSELVKKTPDLLEKLLSAFAEEAHRVDDWFYEIEVEGHRHLKHYTTRGLLVATNRFPISRRDGQHAGLAS